MAPLPTTMGNKDPIGRRRFVRAATGALGVGTFASVTSAQESIRENSDSDSGPFTVENGKLKLDETSDEASTGRHEVHATIRNEYSNAQSIDLQQGVDRLNELRDAGLISFYETNGTVMVESSESFQSRQPNSIRSSQNSPSVSSQSCGKTDYVLKEPELLNPWFRHKFYLDDEDTEYVATRMSQGGTLVAALGAIFSGGLSVVVAAILGAGSSITGGEMLLENEGCGVLLKVKHLPLPPGPYPGIHAVTFEVKIKPQ